MKNLVVKYYTLTDPITLTASKDIGYTYDKTVYTVDVQRVEGIPTIITDTEADVAVEVFPKFAPYVLVNKATYDAVDTTGESETLKDLRRIKTLFVEKYLLAQTLPPPPAPDKTLGELYQYLMQQADAGSVPAAPDGEGGGGELP